MERGGEERNKYGIQTREGGNAYLVSLGLLCVPLDSAIDTALIAQWREHIKLF